jgi:NADP-dependent 3-hydroxy acid dehydrogenase YdfG
MTLFHYQLRNRTGLVTGASSGIGFAVARYMLQEGATVIACGRKSERLQVLQDTADRHGAKLVPILGDVRGDALMESAWASARDTPAGIADICVLCAGRGLPGTILQSDSDHWQELFEVNVLSVMRQLRTIARHLMQDASSTLAPLSRPRDIVVLGSTVGRVISPFNPVYGASKSAVHSATEALRREICSAGIRVTLVEPGVVATDFQANAGYNAEWFKSYSEEIGPVLSADDVAETVLFAVTRPSHIHMNNIVIRPTRQPVP